MNSCSAGRQAEPRQNRAAQKRAIVRNAVHRNRATGIDDDRSAPRRSESCCRGGCRQPIHADPLGMLQSNFERQVAGVQHPHRRGVPRRRRTLPRDPLNKSGRRWPVHAGDPPFGPRRSGRKPRREPAPRSQSSTGSSRIRIGSMTVSGSAARSNKPSLIRLLPTSTAISGVTGSVDMPSWSRRKW